MNETLERQIGLTSDSHIDAICRCCDQTRVHIRNVTYEKNKDVIFVSINICPMKSKQLVVDVQKLFAEFSATDIDVTSFEVEKKKKLYRPHIRMMVITDKIPYMINVYLQYEPDVFEDKP